MKLASLLLAGHLAALLFGLAGLLVALPNPQWWSGDANAVQVFEFGMQYAGATHIVYYLRPPFPDGIGARLADEVIPRVTA